MLIKIPKTEETTIEVIELFIEEIQIRQRSGWVHGTAWCLLPDNEKKYLNFSFRYSDLPRQSLDDITEVLQTVRKQVIEKYGAEEDVSVKKP